MKPGWGVMVMLVEMLGRANGYSTGAPTTKCDNLTPGHTATLQDNNNSPFLIEVSEAVVAPSAKVQLKLTSNDGSSFKGFMVQARSEKDQTIVGNFEIIGGDAKYLNCGGAQSTVTHQDSDPKQRLGLRWLPPAQFQGSVVIFATFVKDYNTFWVKIPSPSIKVTNQPSGEPEPVAGSEPEPEAGSEPEPEAGSEPEPEAGSEPEPEGGSEPEPEAGSEPESGSESERLSGDKPLYKQCGVETTCFGFKNGGEECTKTGDCDLIASWQKSGDGYKFLIESRLGGNGYVAIGFSQDGSMGSEMVLVCHSSGNQPGAEIYWNAGKSPQRLEKDFPVVSSSSKEGVLSCEIDTPRMLKAGDKEVDLDTDIIMLLAGGNYAKGVQYHGGSNRLASAKPVKLAQVQGIGSKSELLIQLHGLLMLAAWIGCAGTGMLMARYYRKTWVGQKSMGVDLWFQAHRTLMISAVLFSILGLILAAVHLGGFSSLGWESVTRDGGGGAHPPLGLATLVLAVINPIMAMFRPHPGTPRRGIFNWAHWFVGNSAHFLAIVTIYLASWVAKPLLRESASATWGWMILAYVVFHVLVHMALSILWAKAESDSNKEEDTVMKDLSGLPSTKEHSSQTNSDAPFSVLRKVLLVIYSITVFIVVIVLISGVFNNF